MGQTGMEEEMKEPYVEVLATHGSPESCGLFENGGRTIEQSARDHGVSCPLVSTAFTRHAVAVLPAQPDPVRVLGIDEIRRGRPTARGRQPPSVGPCCETVHCTCGAAPGEGAACHLSAFLYSERGRVSAPRFGAVFDRAKSSGRSRDPARLSRFVPTASPEPPPLAGSRTTRGCSTVTPHKSLISSPRLPRFGCTPSQ